MGIKKKPRLKKIKNRKKQYLKKKKLMFLNPSYYHQGKNNAPACQGSILSSRKRIPEKIVNVKERGCKETEILVSVNNNK
jgi:hypothetical protein